MMTPDDLATLRMLWSLGNSVLGAGAVAFLLRQSGRVDAMYQHLFGVKGGNGGMSAKIAAIDRKLDTAVSDAADSPAGRELIASLDTLRTALREAANATAIVKQEIGAHLTRIDARLAEIERRPH